MSKKGYVDYAILEYRVERILEAKCRLKYEMENEHGKGKRLILKKIYNKKAEEIIFGENSMKAEELHKKGEHGTIIMIELLKVDGRK